MARKPVPETEREALRRWMRFAVRVSGLSANKLAKAAGVAQTTVTRFLNGYADYAPSRDTIEKLAAAAKIAPPKLDEWEASVHSMLLENNDCRNLISEAVRLAGRLVDDEARVYHNDPEALRKYRDAFLPHYTLLTLDCLIDLQKGGALDASAIVAIETAFKRMVLDRQKEFWTDNPFSPFRGSSEPQSPPSPEVSDPPTPDETDPSPPKQAMPDDSEHPLAA